MVDGLAAVCASVDDDTIALGQAFGAGDLRCRPYEVAEERAIVETGLRQRVDVSAGDDQDVGLRLRMDVGEGVTLVVLIDGGGGNTSVEDLAKQAAHSVTSVQEP